MEKISTDCVNASSVNMQNLQICQNGGVHIV